MPYRSGVQVVKNGEDYKCIECGALNPEILVDGTMEVTVEGGSYDVRHGSISLNVRDVSYTSDESVDNYYCAECDHYSDDLYEVIELIEE